MTALFDPGLQPERTELAWRRTCLALGVGSLAAMRILPEAFGSALWGLGGLGGIAAAGVLALAARRRYRQGTRALGEQGERARLPGGQLGAVVAGFVTAIGLVSVLLILRNG